MGLFDNIFDFNRNGKLEPLERAAEFGLFMHLLNSQKEDKLKSAGLNPNDLENMGYYERRNALEKAGLDPDEFE